MLAGGSCRAGWLTPWCASSLLFWLDIHCVLPSWEGKEEKKKCSLFWWIYTKWAHPPEFPPDGARAPCLRQATRAKPWKGFSFSLKSIFISLLFSHNIFYKDIVMWWYFALTVIPGTCPPYPAKCPLGLLIWSRLGASWPSGGSRDGANAVSDIVYLATVMIGTSFSWTSTISFK